MQGIITHSMGAHHFGIKPYPILVTDVCHSSESEVLEFIVYTKFKHVDGECRVDNDDKFGFNPLDVFITDEIKKWLDDKGLKLNKLAQQRYKQNQKGLYTSIDNIVRRYKEGRIMVVEESECPAFKKHWNAETLECQECKKIFLDEYTTCKNACAAKATAKEKSTVPAVNPEVTPTPQGNREPAVKPDTTSSASVFKGFRQGSRAQILLEYLQNKGSCSFAEAAQHICTTCDVSSVKALDNVKGYVSEWKNDKWSGKSMNFPFTITADKETIRYKENA